MKDFGWNTDDLFVLYDLQNEREARLVFRPSMDSARCELYQASIISTILIERHTPDSASRIGRAIKLLAMCSVGVEPDQVTGTGVQLGYNVAIRVGGGSAAKDYLSVVRRIFDGLHLAVRPNLHSQCTAYPDAGSQEAARKFADLKAREARVGKAPVTKQILAELH